MLNILKTLTDYLLKMEQGEEESCAIPDESIDDWYEQVNEKLETLRKNPQRHHLQIEQLEEISEHLRAPLIIACGLWLCSLFRIKAGFRKHADCLVRKHNAEPGQGAKPRRARPITRGALKAGESHS